MKICNGTACHVQGADSLETVGEQRLGVKPGATTADGEFTVERDRDAVLFAGGTGVTAFTAFLASLTPDRLQRVALFYGARTPDLFVYGDFACRRARHAH